MFYLTQINPFPPLALVLFEIECLALVCVSRLTLSLLWQLAAALSVDALEAIRRTLDNMVKRQHNVFLSTFRRGVVYNRNLTLGIPCNTRPAIPWMHGPVMMLAFKEVGLL